MKLALGTAQFGLDYGIANKRGQVPREELRSILELAKVSGIGMLDTAVAYGDSEKRLGDLGVADWNVVSKLPAVPECDIPQWVRDAVMACLKRLKVEQLYGLLLHEPRQLLEKGGHFLYAALDELKRDGLVRKIGVSIYDPHELDELTKRYDLDIVQAPFNVFDRRLINYGWLPRFQKRGIELHVRSIFLQGLLLLPSGERPMKFDRWSLLWSKYDEWLKEVQLTRLQACVRYALAFTEIDKVIVGVDSLSHLKNILAASHGEKAAVPDRLDCNDIDLINPSRWTNL